MSSLVAGWVFVLAFHVLLERSTPAAGDTLAVVPAELTLTFSGPIEQSASTVRLLGPAGSAWTLEGVRRTDDPRSLAAALPRFGPGGYRVEWRVVSSDGHPIAGDFVFYVSGGAETALESPVPGGVAGSISEIGGMSEMGGTTGMGLQAVAHVSPLLTGVRGATDLALLLGAGLLLFAAWGHGAWGAGASAPAGRTATTAHTLVAAAPLLAVSYAWIWAGEVVSDGATRFAALTSLTTGRAFLVECALAVLAAWALFLARRPRVAAVFAAAAVLAGGLAGHPASYTPSLAIPASALHQLAAAAWAGGLLYLVTEVGSAGFVASMRRVSRVALAAVVAVALTGLVQTWLMLGSPERLFGTTYGMLVLGKVAGLLTLVGFGAYHRFRLLPRLAAAGSSRATPSVVAELALAAGVVVLAAVLSHIPPGP